MPTETVSSFGGGLHLEIHPRFIPPNTWAWSDGFIATAGVAEVAPAYVQQQSSFIVAGTDLLGGIVPYLSRMGQPIATTVWDIVAVVMHVSTNVITLYGIRKSTRTALTLSGGAVKVGGLGPNNAAMPTTACVTTPANNVEQVINCGQPFGASGNPNYPFANPSGMVSLVDQTYTLIAPTRVLTATGSPVLTAASGHVIAGCGTDVAVSDINSTTVWDPAISNSSDDVTIDGPDPIQGAASYLDSAYFLRTLTLYRLTSTGGIPPFTFQKVDERGSNIQTQSLFIAATPLGIFFDGTSDFFLNQQPVGAPIYDYWLNMQNSVFNAIGGSTVRLRRTLWHPFYGCMVVPASFTECLYFDVIDNVWWRRSLPARTLPHQHWDHCVNLQSAAGSQPQQSHYVMDDDGVVWMETPLRSGGVTSPFANAFVDSKDFGWGDPAYRSDIWRIKVDWEPLTNGTTDAIDILLYSRDEFSPLILGSGGFQTDFSSQFVFQGTLTGGSSEIKVRGRGKYHRIRFRQNSGFCRIRGFAVDYMQTTDDQHPR